MHVAVHSYTPVCRGERRNFEVGILYDPQRKRERVFATAWQHCLQKANPDLRARRNAPYRGSSDGLTTALRNEFSSGHYLGFELELNQRSLSRARERHALVAAVAASLRGALETDAAL